MAPETIKKNPNVKLENGLPRRLKGIEAMGIRKEKDYFVENLAILYASGMNLAEALECIKAGIKTKPLIRTIDELIESISQGTPIWKALGATGLLPEHFISLIKVGEESGKLPENLNVIVQQQQKERVFSSRIRSAMMYPVLLLGVATVLGLGIAYFILPNLINVFTQMDMELPFVTRAMIWASDFLQNYGYIAVPSGLIGSLIIFWIFFKNKRTKHIGQGIILSTPVVKNLIVETEVARMGYILGTLLNAGLPIVKALDSLEQTTTYIAYQRLYRHIRDQTEEGKSLRQSFESFKKSDKYIPRPVQHMIMASEQSGKLPETLINVGQIFEDKTETTTKNFTVVLEPLMLVIVWGVVMIVALGVIQPIYSLTGGFNKSIETSGPSTPVEETPEEEAVQGVTSTQTLPTITIVETETGFLNVRDYPSPIGKIIDISIPGSIFEYVEQKAGWYRIKLTSDEYGWVSGNYVTEN